ncbi:MAG: hypothetical protein WCQ60_04055, partial [bacterium]
QGQRGFHVDLPPAEIYFFKFWCSPGANGVAPMVIKSGTAISYKDGVLIRSHGDLRIECLMPFSLLDVTAVD